MTYTRKSGRSNMTGRFCYFMQSFFHSLSIFCSISSMVSSPFKESYSVTQEAPPVWIDASPTCRSLPGRNHSDAAFCCSRLNNPHNIKAVPPKKDSTAFLFTYFFALRSSILTMTYPWSSVSM